MSRHSPSHEWKLDAHDQASGLIGNGYRPIPIPHGTKAPNTPGWNRLEVTHETVANHFPAGAPMNIGLLTQNMPVVDIDVPIAGLAAQIEQEALRRWPGALKRVGQAPKSALILRTATTFAKDATRKYEVDGVDCQVEVLCNGQQLVAFGRHPTTGEDYRWIGLSPLDVAHADLPEVDALEIEDFLDWCETVLSAASVNTDRDDAGTGHSGHATPTSRSARSKPREKSRSRQDWDAMPEPEKELERTRLIALVNATERNTLKYDDWIRLGIALKMVCGDQAFDAWYDFSMKYRDADPDVVHAKWRSFNTDYNVGPGSIVHQLKMAGLSEDLVSSSARELTQAKQALQQRPTQTSGTTIDQEIRTITPTRFVLPLERDIPPRVWLYGRFLIRSFLSLTVAPGGTGKSALVIGEALALASGKNLHGVEVPKKAVVWIWNGEDPKDELDRRLAAAIRKYGLKSADIDGRLMVDTGRKLPIKIAEMDHGSIRVAQPLVDELIDVIRAEGIDVLIIDPFATSHLVPENDNGALNAVVDAWRRIADATGCAIHLVHHVNKAAALHGDSGIYGSRGAGALIDGVRAARFLQKMTKEEATSLGLASPAGHFQVIDGKMNLAPALDDSQWFKIENVRLANGDDVGVCVRWEKPEATSMITPDARSKIFAALGDHSGLLKANEQAHDWIGYAIADALGWQIGPPSSKASRSPDENDARMRIRSLISEWIKKGALKKYKHSDGRRGRGIPCLKPTRASASEAGKDAGQ